MENKKATMQPSSESVNVTGLKMVKNASIFSENGVYFIRHYKTIIFAYNPQNQKCEVKMGLSLTSNRQIKEALNFFEIQKASITDVMIDQDGYIRGFES